MKILIVDDAGSHPGNDAIQSGPLDDLDAPPRERGRRNEHPPPARRLELMRFLRGPLLGTSSSAGPTVFRPSTRDSGK